MSGIRGSAIMLNRPNMPAEVVGKNVVKVVDTNYFQFEQNNVMLYTYFFSERVGKDWNPTNINTGSWLFNSARNILYATEPIEMTDCPVQVSMGPSTSTSLIPLNEWVLMAALREKDFGLVSIPFKKNKDVIDIRTGGRVRLIPSDPWTVCVEKPSAGDDEAMSTSLIDWYSENQQIVPPGETLSVICKHYTMGKKVRKYMISRISNTSAIDQKFVYNGSSISVFEYFEKFKSIELKRSELPLAVDVRGRFLPLELCEVVYERRRNIDLSKIQIFFSILEPFGIRVNFKTPLSLNCRPWKPSNPISLPDRSKELPGCKAWILTWGGENNSAGIVDCVKSKGLDISVSHTLKIASFENWEDCLKEELNKAGETAGPCDIVIVLTQSRLPRDVYLGMKKIFDQKLGIPSQVICVDRLAHFIDNGLYARELANQIIVKVSPAIRPGRAAIGQRKSSIPQVTTALVGIWTETVPSLPGIVLRSYSMSVDLTMPHNRFVHQVSISTCKSAPHEPDDKTVYELLMNFFGINCHFPTRIIVYERSRSSTAMFSQVAADLGSWNNAVNRINRELRTRINTKLSEFTKDEIHPNLTLIQCERVAGTMPGSLCDDKLVTEHKGMNFYVHALGNKYATQYRAIHDQNSFTLTELQNYTFDMCLGVRALPVCLGVSKKHVERVKLYIESELNTLANMKGDPVSVSEYLNQVFSSEFLPIHRLNDSGRSCFL